MKKYTPFLVLLALICVSAFVVEMFPFHKMFLAREIVRVHRDMDGHVEYDVRIHRGSIRRYVDYYDDGIIDDIQTPYESYDSVFNTGWKSQKGRYWNQVWAQERFDVVRLIAKEEGVRYWE